MDERLPLPTNPLDVILSLSIQSTLRERGEGRGKFF